jgi:hypothetical protein
MCWRRRHRGQGGTLGQQGQGQQQQQQQQQLQLLQRQQQQQQQQQWPDGDVYSFLPLLERPG